MSKVQLGYWNIRGLAQPIRVLLEYLAVPYEEAFYVTRVDSEGVVDRSDWTKVKSGLGMEFANLPYILDGDVKISQSDPILKHICRKHAAQMLGKTPCDQAKVEEYLAVLADYKNAMARTCYSKKQDLEKFMGSFKKNNVDAMMPVFAGILKDKTFVLGDYVSVVDFVLYEVAHICRLMFPTVFDSAELAVFKKYLDNFAAMPKVKEYIASDKCIKKQFNNFQAAWQGPTTDAFPCG